MYRLYLPINSELNNVVSPQNIRIVQSMVGVHKVHSSSCVDNGVDLIHKVCVVIFTHSQIQQTDITCYK